MSYFAYSCDKLGFISYRQFEDLFSVMDFFSSNIPSYKWIRIFQELEVEK